MSSNGTHFVATTANRASYGRAVGISATAGDLTVPVVQMIEAGIVPASITGLAAGAVSWVRVSAAGVLERVTPGSGDDIVGKAHADGSVQFAPGVFDSDNYAGGGGGGGGTPGGATTHMQYNLAGAFAGDSGFTYDAAGRATLSVGASIGATPATFGTVRLANATTVYARNAANNGNIEVLGITSGDVIELGATTGQPIVVGTGLGQILTLDAVETIATQVLQIGTTAADVGGASGSALGIHNAAVIPSTNPTNGVIFYSESGVAKVRQANGTVVTIGSVAAPTGTGIPHIVAGVQAAAASIGTSLQVHRTNAAATDVEWATLPETVVNVLDYWDAADASPTIDGHTTRDISPALQRAYAAKIATDQHIVLWLPPTAPYGVDAWSWDGGLHWNIYSTADNVIYLEIRGSGAASKLIVNPATLNTKLAISAGGPEGMPTHFTWRNMFVCGTGAPTDVDCVSLLSTTVDMQVLFEGCIFYGLLATAELFDISSMGFTSRNNYIHGCGSTANTAIFAGYGGLNGWLFEQTHVYKWERDVDPFGVLTGTGNGLDKMGYDVPQYCHLVWIKGDTEENAPRVRFEQCTFSHAGLLGAVLADPSADGYYIDSVAFDQCYFTQICKFVIHAVSNVRSVSLERCRVSHNYGGQDSIKLFDSTCLHLSLVDNVFSHSLIKARAKTGQASVYLRGNTGGDLDFSGATNVCIDAATTWDVYADSGTAAPAARVPETAIVKSSATDLTLTADQYAYDMIRITGTPGGAFNLLGPNIARTRFTIVNATPSQCTIKKSGGTGIAIATGKSAQVYHNGTDYIRLTPDA